MNEGMHRANQIEAAAAAAERRKKTGNAYQKQDAKRAGRSAIDLYTGRLLFEHADAEIPSCAMPIYIAHEYNSDYYNEEASAAMKLGKGWRLNIQQQIDTADGVCYVDGKGLRHEIAGYPYDEERVTTAYDAGSNRLVRRYHADGAYVINKTKEGLEWYDEREKYLRGPDLTKYYFEAEKNWLSRVESGDKRLYIIRSGEKITKVTDNEERTVLFSYNASGYLSEISYSGDKTVRFGYTGDKLTSITDADGNETKFSYANNRLTKVTDCSGYELHYAYEALGRIREAEEQAQNASIGASVITGGSTGDKYEIKYLSDHTRRTKNRNGVCMNYLFNDEGDLVTQYESETYAASAETPGIIGKATYNRSTLMQRLTGSTASREGYYEKRQIVNTTLYNGDNMLVDIETWTGKENLSAADGPTPAAWASGGSSYRIQGEESTQKRLYASVPHQSLERGVYVFGCWLKVTGTEEVSDEYAAGNSMVGLMLKYKYGSSSEKIVYVPADVKIGDWQLVAVPLYIDTANVVALEAGIVVSNNNASVYADKAYFAKAPGGVTYMYDNNYSETIYRDYKLAVLYNENMQPVKTVSAAAGKQYETKNYYDAARRLVKTIDWRGRTTEKTYDSSNNVLTETLTGGTLKLRTSNAYTDGHYLTAATDEIGNTSKFQYDEETGELVKGTFPKGQAIAYSYDPFGALKKVTALSSTNNLVYNKGYLVRLSHAGAVYHFVYDGFGRIKSVTLDGTAVLTNTYTDFGTDLDGVAGAVSRIISKDGNGDTQTAYFDKYGKTLGIKQGSGAVSSETYDANDNLTRHIDNVNEIEYNYAYTKDGDLAEHTQKKNGEQKLKHTITYDGMDRASGESYTIGARTFNYGYTYAEYPEEDVTAMTTPLGQITYTKDGPGRLTEKVRVAGYGKKLTSKYYYNGSNTSGYTTGQVSKLVLSSEGATTQMYEYWYDANGNITKIEQGRGIEYRSYEYDGLNKLTREDVWGQRSVRYSYNTAGNITEKQLYPYTSPETGLSSGQIQKVYRYTYDTAHKDRLISYDGKSIAYNAAGYPTNYLGNAVTWSQGRMTKFGTTTFAYNDAGVRIRKGTTEYYTEGTRILAESRNGAMIYYSYDESGIAGFEYGGRRYYYRKNIQGDVTGIYDEFGTMLGGYNYDAWGKILSQTANEIVTLNPFRYRGYYYDTETSLYYLNTRYYDPETGRFISPDSIDYLDPVSINGLNLYAYCGNNPVMYVDPNGSFPVLALILGVTAIAGMGLTIGGVASNNNILTAIGLTMVAVPALISGGMAIAAGIDGATFLGMMGGGTVVAGLGSALFASAEYQTIFTGNNWMLNAGMSNEWYYGLMLTTTTLATIGTISCGVLGSIGNMSSANTMMNSLKNHPGRWKIVKQQISKALGRKYKGGISKYTNYVNRWTGARLGTHEIIRNEIYIHGPHIHPWI